MSYTLVPLDSRKIISYAKYTYTETVVRNLLATEQFYGFLGAHGKRLKGFGDSLLRDYHTALGSFEARFSGIPFHKYKRMHDHYNNALQNGLIRVTENLRHVVDMPVTNGLSTPIAYGDLVWSNAGSAVGANGFTFTSNLATTQGNFSAQFVGIALGAKVASDGTVILRVDMSPNSYWDFATVSGTHKVGDTFGPAKAAGNALLSNTLAPANYHNSIARVMRVDASSAASVLVRVQSAYWGHNINDIEGAQHI